MALAVRRPSNRARIVACWVAVIVVAVLACGIAVGPESDVSPTGDKTPAVRRALGTLIANWYTAVHGIIVTVAFAGMVAVAMQLMRTSARDFHGRQDGPTGLWELRPPGTDEARQP
jgi:NADH:ubiquinone oxidoreductase subunit 6 (subunit J)